MPCGRGEWGTRSREGQQHTYTVLLPTASGELCKGDNSRESRWPRVLQTRPVRQAGYRTRLGVASRVGGRRGGPGHMHVCPEVGGKLMETQEPAYQCDGQEPRVRGVLGQPLCGKGPLVAHLASPASEGEVRHVMPLDLGPMSTIPANSVLTSCVSGLKGFVFRVGLRAREGSPAGEAAVQASLPSGTRDSPYRMTLRAPTGGASRSLPKRVSAWTCSALEPETCFVTGTTCHLKRLLACFWL